MRTINLKSLIEINELDQKEIADILFPSNKYPGLALNRVITGEAQLDALQIGRLASYLGTDINQLYEIGGWKMYSDEKSKIRFTLGDFKVILDTESNVSKVFHRDTLFHDTILHSKSIALSVYLAKINEIINIYKAEQNENQI